MDWYVQSLFYFFYFFFCVFNFMFIFFILQVFVVLCRINEGVFLDRFFENIWNEIRVVNDLVFEMEIYLFSVFRNVFKEFLCGVELLSYFFNKFLVIFMVFKFILCNMSMGKLFIVNFFGRINLYSIRKKYLFVVFVLLIFLGC